MMTAGAYEDGVPLHTDTGAMPERLLPGILPPRSPAIGMGLLLPTYSFSSDKAVRDIHPSQWTICSVSIFPTPFVVDPCLAVLTPLS
jgi:hypothetical protein